MVDGCLFCSIVAGEIPADFVLDTADVVAFLDHRPLFPGHTLVVPRAHFETLRDLDDATRDELFAQVQRVAAAVQDATGSAGSFVAMNNVVSQSVPHAPRARRAPEPEGRPAGLLLAPDPLRRRRRGRRGRGRVDPRCTRRNDVIM